MVSSVAMDDEDANEIKLEKNGSFNAIQGLATSRPGAPKISQFVLADEICFIPSSYPLPPPLPPTGQFCFWIGNEFTTEMT